MKWAKRVDGTFTEDECPFDAPASFVPIVNDWMRSRNSLLVLAMKSLSPEWVVIQANECGACLTCNQDTVFMYEEGGSLVFQYPWNHRVSLDRQHVPFTEELHPCSGVTFANAKPIDVLQDTNCMVLGHEPCRLRSLSCAIVTNGSSKRCESCTSLFSNAKCWDLPEHERERRKTLKTMSNNKTTASAKKQKLETMSIDKKRYTDREKKRTKRRLTMVSGDSTAAATTTPDDDDDKSLEDLLDEVKKLLANGDVDTQRYELLVAIIENTMKNGARAPKGRRYSSRMMQFGSAMKGLSCYSWVTRLEGSALHVSHQ